jgi:hypothetical protein
MDLLSYMLAYPAADLGDIIAAAGVFTPSQLQVAAVLTQFVDARLPLETEENRPHVVRALLMETDEHGVPIARRLHDEAGTVDAEPEPDGDIEAALVLLARDCYPGFLLPADPQVLIPGRDEVSFLATSLLFRHPQAERFSTAVLQDQRLSLLFSKVDESSGWSTYVYASTGQGGGLQLATLPDLVLRSAWREVQDDDRSAESFVTRVLEVWRLVRDVLCGEPRSTVARFSFTGVLLPAGLRVEFEGGVLREATAADRRIAPESLKQQLGGTDVHGVSTTINYDGDVIFEVRVPYKVMASQPPQSGAPPGQWPADLHPPDSLERSLTRLRACLLLGVRRDHRVQIVPAWRSFDDPLSWGRALSWFDPTRAVGLMPTALTEDEVAEWVKWYRLLDTPSVDRIDIALSRVLRAVGERREPSDVLIDSVIAWENLFGTSEGEPTLRVTASLALLLENDPSRRRELRSTLAKIYGLRSKVVHGSHVLGPADFPLCYEALEVALKAIRTLVESRPDVLELRDGGARSLRLIVER